ncbi:Rrf2 family transcriptional regulator [bacterium]|nr:Rrf2 family transcriptional regulator [bacterium]
MRVTLDRRGDYAVRAVLDLTTHSPDLQKTREIAQRMDIPMGFLSQILAELVREGLLVATAGPSGGYGLARPADEITVLDVVTCIEGPVTLERCVLRGDACDAATPCAVHETWADAQAQFSARLSATTFADLAG